MCDTQEHIKIGEKAFSWARDILKSGHAGPGYDWVNNLVNQKYEKGAYPKKRPLLFFLTNEAQVSYGDILAMAGDFYPEYGGIFADRKQLETGHALLLDSDAPTDDNPGVTHKDEIDAILSAYHQKLNDEEWVRRDEIGARPGINRIDLGAIQKRLQQEGVPVGDQRWDWQSHDFGRVLCLALKNPDHFGIEAVEKWERYHKLACAVAAEGRRYYQSGDLAGYEALSEDGHLPANRGKPCEPVMKVLRGKKEYALVNSLWLALRYNAFGDHFLSDLFSAGHMRTPRWDLMQRFPIGGYAVPLGNLGTALTGSAYLDLASVLSGIHHDEDGTFGLWCELLLGKVRVGSLGNGCPAINIDQFFARGDGHYLNPENVDARALCYRAVALSIRDVLFASLIGDDPRKAPSYWNPFGGKQQSRWASLRLVPKPLPPDPRWTVGTIVRNSTGELVRVHELGVARGRLLEPPAARESGGWPRSPLEAAARLRHGPRRLAPAAHGGTHLASREQYELPPCAVLRHRAGRSETIAGRF